MADSKANGMLGAGSAALRRVVSETLGRRKRSHSAVELENADSLNAIIEGEIIPKLLMAHAVEQASGKANSSKEIALIDAHKFALLPLRLEVAGLLEEVDAFLEDGVSVEAIYLDLLAPAARRLGEMWVEDECDFVDVTMGLWRLQEVMREISARSPSQRANLASDAPRALFAPLPGDQHSFGALMMDEIFARSGWNSTSIARPLRKELLDTVSREPFDLVGLTVSRDCPSSAIANFIKAVRKVSANPNLSILIGGHMINQNPAIVAEVGADGTGTDARAALAVAERLVQVAPVRAHMLR